MIQRQLKKLGDVCSMQNGFAFKSNEYMNEGFFVMRIKNVQKGYIDLDDPKYINLERKKEFEKFILNKGDILMSLTGNIGRVGTIKQEHLPAVLNQRVARIIVEKHTELVFGFLFHFLNSNLFEKHISSLGVGAAQQNISLSSVCNTLLPLPPLATQHAIVAKLDAVQTEISEAKQSLQTQLDALDTLWQSSLSEVFENGECEKVKLGSIIEKTSQINPLNYPEEFFTYIDISSIDKDIQKITNPNSFIGKDAPSRAKKHVQKGDIIFATTRPNLKNIAIIENNYPNVVASTGFCVLRPSKKAVQNYLFYFLITENIQDQISPLIRGAQYPAISDKDLLNTTFALPSLAEQKSIVAHLDALSVQITALRADYTQQLQHYETLRASILDTAFRGELVR